MDKNLSKEQKQLQLQLQQQSSKFDDLDEPISSSQSMNQISSVSTTDSSSSLSSKNSTNSMEKKATHSEIEKRRRQKMNKHLNELAFHLPGVNTKNKKPDKLTILKLAVQHLKSLKASNSLLNDSFICQNYMKPIELQSLVLNESEEFFIVIKCDSSKIVFISESCVNSIGFSSNDLIDKSFFEITHTSDHKQIKEQLNYQESSLNIKNPVDSTNNYSNNKKKLYTTGDRRAFLCRIRSCLNDSNKSLKPINQLCVYNEPDYKLAHFVGYLRSDFTLKYENTENPESSIDDTNDQCSSTFVSDNDELYSSNFLNTSSNDDSKRNFENNKKSANDSNQSNGNFLFAYAQVKSKVNEVDLQTRFITKHDADGKFVHIDPNIYPILGYLPEQLISETIFNYIHSDDIPMLKKVFQEAILNSPTKIKTADYRVRLENNKSFAIIESVIFALKNPFTNSLEYILSQNKFCSISLISSSNQFIQQQQIQQQQKKKLVTSLNSSFSMPMTPSPEDNRSPETIKYNESIAKNLSSINMRLKNNNIPVSFNSKLKQKDTIFQIDNNNNLIIVSEINSNQLNLLPIENQNDMFKNSQQSSQDNFGNYSTSTNLQSGQNTNLFNENQQILFDINDNFNDFISKSQSNNNQSGSTGESNPNKAQSTSNQNSYNLMLKNNTVQENAEMLMEIFKNDKSFHQTTSTLKTEKS